MLYNMNSLGEIDYSNTKETLAKIVNHIRYLQEQIEYLSMLVDKENTTDNGKEV